VKERPILFQPAMVHALLAGTKTQTRRVVKGMRLEWLQPNNFTPEFVANPENGLCPYGFAGDRLWVRERGWMAASKTAFLPFAGNESPNAPRSPDGTPYRSWPSIHMPRWACRLVLEVTSVRVERLQAISEADSRAEGAPGYEEGVDAPPPEPEYEWSYRASYRRLWEQINGPGSWDANPWVWVVEFRRTV
jgi:hypothetical protein